jgi:hypothetical protein
VTEVANLIGGARHWVRFADLRVWRRIPARSGTFRHIRARADGIEGSD